MLVRRLSGLLTGLLMLHLSFVGWDLACAQHGDRPASAHNNMLGHHGHHVAAARVESATASDQPCETPTQPACCHAMTSCAINAAFERGTRLASVPPARNVIELAVIRVPLSQITSPDPPPPKA
jgi:hypothetical protein